MDNGKYDYLVKYLQDARGTYFPDCHFGIADRMLLNQVSRKKVKGLANKYPKLGNGITILIINEILYEMRNYGFKSPYLPDKRN